MNPAKRKLRIELEGLDALSCEKLGGRMEDNKCVVEKELEGEPKRVNVGITEGEERETEG